MEAGLDDGDKAGAEVEMVPESKSAAEFALVVSGYEAYHSLSPKVVD